MGLFVCQVDFPTVRTPQINRDSRWTRDNNPLIAETADTPARRVAPYLIDVRFQPLNPLRAALRSSKKDSEQKLLRVGRVLMFRTDKNVLR